MNVSRHTGRLPVEDLVERCLAALLKFRSS
jgi:hypothetical protein